MVDLSSNSRQLSRITLGAELTPLGEQIISMGYADEKQIQKAIRESSSSGRDLISVLQKITGKLLPISKLSFDGQGKIFKLKILYGIDSLDSEINQIPIDQVNELIEDLVSVDICRCHQLVPLILNREADPPSLLVAMVDPDNLKALDDLHRILRPQNIIIQRIEIAVEGYHQLIDNYLDLLIKNYLNPKDNNQNPVESQELDFNLEDDLDYISALDGRQYNEINTDLGVALKDAGNASVIALVNKILIKAIQEEVSDIHIEPQKNSLQIRFRKDGVLLQGFDPIPKKSALPIITRFKMIADLDIVEQRLPQDGRIYRLFQDRRIEFRASTLPSFYGERIVLQLIDHSSIQLGLDKIFTESSSLNIVRKMINLPSGLIIVTGPVRSGRTSTLYSFLSEINHPNINIITSEEYIKYNLPGLNQSTFIREKSMGVISTIKACFKQDPDVIMIGEIWDAETANIAIEAAMRGHLILTKLTHIDDTVSAISRLKTMNISPLMIANSLVGIIAQRLVRKVCHKCRISYQPNSTELSYFNLTESQESELILYKANTLSVRDILASNEEICSACNGMGYIGRFGVYEVMKVTESLRSLIAKDAPIEQIRETAIAEEMQTLMSHMLNFVKRGETTLDEVRRALFLGDSLGCRSKVKYRIASTPQPKVTVLKTRDRVS